MSNIRNRYGDWLRNVFDGFLTTIFIISSQAFDSITLLELVNEHSPSVIFLNGYFGFDGLQGIRKHISSFRENGIFVIEDITQGLFSKYPMYTFVYWLMCSLK